MNSENNGSYYGGDGSWGHIDEDGSGSYYGADGSWGHKDSNGKIDFYGADGSWEHKDSSDHSSDYGIDNNTVEDNESIGGILGDILGKGIESLAAASMMQAREEERRHQEKWNKRHEFCKKHRKGISLSILLLIITISILFGVWEIEKLTPIGYDATEIIGVEYTNVVSDLQNAGFTNIKLKAVEDLDIAGISSENKVFGISILGNEKFTSDSRFPYDIKIIIKYHTLKLQHVPISSKDAKGSNYADTVASFEEAGFANVKTEVVYDLVTGWINSDGEIKSITINGENKFKEGDEYRMDSEIIITYHGFKKRDK